jgi:hypothetical protein
MFKTKPVMSASVLDLQSTKREGDEAAKKVGALVIKTHLRAGEMGRSGAP